MTASKTYLNVPFAQKDAAKALGARWDPAKKKWYVPPGKDIAPFAQWHSDDAASETVSPANGQSNSALASGSGGVFTQPTIADFIAYSSDLPPWD